MTGVACDVRHLPRSRLLLDAAPVVGSAPLLPGEFEHYDGVVFGGSAHNGHVYVLVHVLHPTLCLFVLLPGAILLAQTWCS